jgi:hypothetical protein
MSRSNTLMGAAVAAMVMTGSTASADVITFNDLAPQSFSTPTTFFDAGYKLVYTPGSNGFAQIGNPPSCSPACASNGTNAFYSFNTGSLTISAVNGNPISITSLDAAQTFTTLNRILDFTVTGLTESSTTVSQQFVTAAGAADSFQTFNINTPGFTDLASLTISGTGVYPTTEFAVDNLVISAAPSPTPGAGLLSYVALGFLGLGSVGWRRLRASQRPQDEKSPSSPICPGGHDGGHSRQA